MAEYAKFVKLPITITNATGFQADLELPSSTNVPNTGYINFYVGMGEYEAGISTQGAGWRWFVNSVSKGRENNGNFGEYSNGQSVNIRLELLQNSGTDYRIKFYVNNALKHNSMIKYNSSSTFGSGRLMIACNNVNLPEPVATPLPPFTLRHAQVTANNIKYKSGSNSWTMLTSGNCTPQIFHTPSGFATPAPIDYTVSATSFSSGYYYASIK